MMKKSSTVMTRGRAWAVLAAAIGMAAGASRADTNPPAEASPAPVPAKTEAPAASASPAAASVSAAQAEAARQARLDGMIRAAGLARMKSQWDARMGTLKGRLTLTPEQEEALKKASGEEMAALEQTLARVQGGAGLEDLARLARWERGEAPATVEALFSPEQKTVYTAWRAEERARLIEAKAWAELAGVRKAAGVTPEQNDQAVAALRGLMEQEAAMNFMAMPDTGTARARMEEALHKRLDLLGGILTEPQMAAYRQQVEAQRRFIGQLLPSTPAAK